VALVMEFWLSLKSSSGADSTSSTPVIRLTQFS
jgi:hypothetical protein